MIDKRLVELRKRVRSSRKIVIDTMLEDHSANICIVCGATDDLTKEHVVPKWAFDNNQKKFFVTAINGIGQSYSKTTLHACEECNGHLLGSLERHIEQLFRHSDVTQTPLSDSDKQKVILWLELIDYKFQALDLRRKLKKPKDGPYIKFLADYPVGVMQRLDFSPSKVFSMFRNSLKRLEIADKSKRLNSLVVFSTSNENYHFFHQANEYIFVELPQHKIALFYYINKSFIDERSAYESAMNIIKKVY